MSNKGNFDMTDKFQPDDNITEEYRSEYSSSKFWKKITEWSCKLGEEVIYQGLFLFYCMRDPAVPVSTKVTIGGALGYFIAPIDLIPDVTPGVGHLDDASVLFSAYCQAQIYASPETRRKAQAKLDELFRR